MVLVSFWRFPDPDPKHCYSKTYRWNGKYFVDDILGQHLSLRLKFNRRKLIFSSHVPLDESCVRLFISHTYIDNCIHIHVF